MQQLGFKLLNRHLLGKTKSALPTSPAVISLTATENHHLGCPRQKNPRHTFNYKLMKENQSRASKMKSVWEIKPPETWEKRFGKHPTPKSPSPSSNASS